MLFYIIILVISFASIIANNGGTALPICLFLIVFGPKKIKSSGKD
jgi:hypothetical protein